MKDNVNVIINGKAYRTEDLNVTIPGRYQDRFEGHRFADMHDFSMAIMYARCAQEARYSGEPLAVMLNERTLNNFLKG